MLNAFETKEILNVGIEITTEKDKKRLLEKMLDKAICISGCDAGTLYIVKDGKLYFEIMRTLSMGVHKGGGDERIDLPPVEYSEGNVCAYAAIHKELINIADVYKSDKFDFSGPKKYDGITGYHTCSMLVIPMEDGEGKVIGVLQLINKLGENGEIVSFTEDDAFVLRSLGSMAAVSLSNMIYLEDIKHQMHSFVQAFATAIDKRTPYNGSHTRMVTEYAVLVAKRLDEMYRNGEGGEAFDSVRTEQLSLAAGLHDIGKMIVPLSVMNKSSRLGDAVDAVKARFGYLRVLYERDMLRGDISEQTYRQKLAELDGDLAFILATDTAGFLTDEALERVLHLSQHVYRGSDGTEIAYLTQSELHSLCVRKGTLTDEERKVMESHVEMTGTILSQVYFTETFENALRFASEHHEFLNGSGYPRGLSGDALAMETRILTAVDIFDALTCTDRPYKKPMPKARAIEILRQMVGEGKLDGTVVDALDDVVKASEPGTEGV